MANPTSSAGYVWEDPGDSMMIQVSLELIERLAAAVQQGLGSGPRGNEIGGILLGRTLSGYGRAILVDDFELTPCEHLRGASYTLSPRDRRALGAHLSRRDPKQVIGYFRSHTRPGMYLDQEDFNVFSQYFPEPWQAFLLIRPSASAPAMGGFFFWEDGDVNRRSTYRQFPFDCARLAEDHYPVTGSTPVVAEGPRHVPVLVPKSEVRASRSLRLPPLPWVVVPLIAVLFLIAGLFVSEKPTPPAAVVAAKAIPPVEPLLPEPVVTSAPAPAVAPVAQAPAAVVPQTAIKPKPTNKLAPQTSAPAPAPLTVARVSAREVEPPPALAVPAAKLESRVAAVLPAKIASAPPLESEVSYEAPRAGVFKRALHKIEGSEGDPAAFVPPSPIHKVPALKPAAIGAEVRPVDVKVFIDDTGAVSRAQLLTKSSELSSAALTAARQWQFKPARKHDKPVSSEMVLHFR